MITKPFKGIYTISEDLLKTIFDLPVNATITQTQINFENGNLEVSVTCPNQIDGTYMMHEGGTVPKTRKDEIVKRALREEYKNLPEKKDYLDHVKDMFTPKEKVKEPKNPITTILVQTQQGKTVGSLNTISYAINREMAPIYTIGNQDPKEYVRGKRSIAGSMVTSEFDMEWLLSKDKNDHVEPLHIIVKTLDGNDFSLVGCKLLKSGYPAIYRDLYEHNACITFIAQSMTGCKEFKATYKSREQEQAEEFLKEYKLEFKDTDIPAEQFAYASGELPDKDKEGVIYNPVTDRWSWL